MSDNVSDRNTSSCVTPPFGRELHTTDPDLISWKRRVAGLAKKEGSYKELPLALSSCLHFSELLSAEERGQKR